MEQLLRHLSREPVTCITLLLYSSNVVWHLSQGQKGRAFYWLAAAQITVAATWMVE